MDKFLAYMIKAIVDKPDDVNVTTSKQENTVIYELSVDDEDLGKVIGKKGKNINAIRTLFSAANSKDGGKRAIIEVIE